MGDADILIPNFKSGVTGVTATIIQLTRVHHETARVAIVGRTPGTDLPTLSLLRLVHSWRRRRIWHARRNNDLVVGLILKHVLGLNLAIVFTCSNPRPRTRLTRAMLSRIDAIVGTSAAMQDCMPQRLAAVIPHGINLQAFQPTGAKASLRQQLGLPEGILIGSFGRIRPEKGTDILVDAGLELLKETPDVHLLIVGKVGHDHQGYFRKLQTTIAEAGAGDKFLFREEVPYANIPLWYQALDLFVAVPRWEGFGLTVLEALASGVPCLATRQGIFADILIPGKTGQVADTTPGAVAAALAELLADITGPHGAYRRVAEAIPTTYLIEAEAQSLLDLYTRLLGRPLNDRGPVHTGPAGTQN